MRKRPMVALPEYVQRVVAGGREYFYFRRSGERIPLPRDPHSPEFYRAYREAIGAEIPQAKRFKELVEAYKHSPEFARLSENTKRDYASYLKIIDKAWGDLTVNGLRPKNVLTLRDAWAHAPVKADHLISVAKTLINWGIPREFSDTNPCLAIGKLSTDSEGARPWPAWAYPLIEEHAREDLRRAVLLARYTGQRQEDVLDMNEGRLADNGIAVKQRKTGKRLWVPLHEDVREEIAGWQGQFVQTPKGTAYTTGRFRAAWTRLMNNTPAGRIRREGFTFHGLRASSVEKLREVGCDYAEIESITGMSHAMIRRYSRFADQKRLAQAAVRRLEAGV